MDTHRSPTSQVFTYSTRRRAAARPSGVWTAAGTEQASGAPAAPGPALPRGGSASGRAASWGPGQSGVRSSCKGSAAACSPAADSVKWQHLEDGVSFGRAPGSSSRRRARRALLAGSRPAPGRPAPQVAAEGARLQGAPSAGRTRVTGGGRSHGHVRNRRSGAGAELAREAAGSGHRPHGHPKYTTQTAVIPQPGRNQTPKFRRKHKRASHFTSLAPDGAPWAANRPGLCPGERRCWCLGGGLPWGEPVLPAPARSPCAGELAAASPRPSHLGVPAPGSTLSSQTRSDLKLHAVQA